MGPDPNVGAVRLVLAMTFLAAVVVLGSGTAAHACSCIGTPPAQQVAEADAVFTGELTSVTPARVDDIGLYEHAFRFDVDEVFAGSIGPTAEVLSALGGAACGLEPAVGQRWVIVASRGEPHPEDLTTSSCVASRPIGETTPRFLAAGQPPDASVAAPPDRTVDTRSLALAAAVGGAAVIALVTGAIRLGRRPMP
jgi:hypothetical protein